MSTARLICFAILAFAAEGASRAIRDLIPPSFPNQDPSDFALRYVSQSEGVDSISCLLNQSISGTRQACQSLVFALTNITISESVVLFSANATDISNLIVLISPGEYDYSEGGINVFNASNLIIAKDPSADGEVVFRCLKLVNTVFNNLFFKFVDHLAIAGISGSGCGVLGTNMAFIDVTDLSVVNCTFRYNFAMHANRAHASQHIHINTAHTHTQSYVCANTHTHRKSRFVVNNLS